MNLLVETAEGLLVRTLSAQTRRLGGSTSQDLVDLLAGSFVGASIFVVALFFVFRGQELSLFFLFLLFFVFAVSS